MGGGRSAQGATGALWYLTALAVPPARVFLGHPLVPQTLLPGCCLYPGVTPSPSGGRPHPTPPHPFSVGSKSWPGDLKQKQ